MSMGKFEGDPIAATLSNDAQLLSMLPKSLGRLLVSSFRFDLFRYESDLAERTMIASRAKSTV